MAVSVPVLELPFKADEDGVLRVADTRVRLETVLQAYREGATPEEIVQDYDVLTLADVYAAITYALQHPAATQQYLDERTQQRQRQRQENERVHPQTGWRARLLARQAQQHNH